MTPLFWALVFIVSTCESLSIGVTKQNVTKRETNTKNIYPDWVPFKSDKGELLEELVHVAKSKPKKRLAHPKNFVLKAVAEPQGDDYYDKGQGDSDNEDYFEKKEWTDVNREAKPVDPSKPINHTNVSDIEGIVNIITKPKDDPVLRVLKARSKKVKEEVKPQEKVKRQNEDEISEENVSNDEKVEESKESNEDNQNKKESKKDEDDTDYEEESAEKKKTDEEIAKEEEQKESEAKKKKLLDSVDALKERHAVEQRTISEKLKEEEIYKDELERDRIKPRENGDKYSQGGTGWKKLTHDYEEYEDQNPIIKDKYKLNPLKSGSVTTSTTNSPRTPEKRKPKKTNKTVASGKLSVFRNPQLYIINDEEDTSTTSTTTENPTTDKTHKPKKFSSRYSESSTPEEDNVRISLVPENSESKEGEPTLFFPKLKKNKRKFKNKQTTPVPDSTADSSEEKEKASEATSTDSTSEINTAVTGAADITAPSASDADSSASNTAVTASKAAPTAIAAPLAVDSVQAGTHKKEKKNEDFHRETGGGKHHKSEHDEIHDEHGKKAYEADLWENVTLSWRYGNDMNSDLKQRPWYYHYAIDGVHKDTKSNKGHHDKENHLDKYNDHGGIDKSHHDEDNHYGSHHHEEHGKKHAKYEESGKHSKGHSTKGSHDIHKKEEYEKKVEFFEEEGDSDDEEFDGGHSSKKEHSSGGHFKKGQHHSSHGGHSKGEKGDFAKGGHGHHVKGHKSSEGHDSHGEHGDKHHEDAGKKGGRKWVYHHGSPAKTHNLVLIDRRTDGYMHGPMYYG